ncbi:EAL domain-containing protein [Dechloromonas sp. HYN0024]|uniref:EAL domain-containing protein n=1 Tax=Dechloromonas sp. HYN0024 TaxID=2231055 RepID=UPI0013C2F2D8|nr:EAL domain-containing protein [Dechloromonas sp. HYN0024]
MEARHVDLDDEAWIESTIFGLHNLVSSGSLNNPTIDTHVIRMDESRIRLAANVFANSHDGIMITDPLGVVVDVNRAYSKITGFPPDELIGRQSNLLTSDHHPVEFRDSLRESLQTKGFWRGEVSNLRKNGKLCTEFMSVSAVYDSIGEVTHFVAIYTDISALKESQRQLEHLAYHDALTGLPNRVLLVDRIQHGLAQATRRKGLVAVCFLDLDDFKPINDLYGHNNGDLVLIEVAQRLKQAVREGDTVARIGGDEFAVLLTDLEGPQDAKTVILRMLDSVARPYSVDSATAVISASIGYTLIPGDDGDPDNLLRHADQAMYVAKEEGRNRIHLFDIEHDQRTRSKRENVSRIKKACQDNEFRLFYQPKVDMRRGKVVGMEALIRWQHPELGLLSPADFLLPLGDHPLLVDIGNWAIREALGQMAKWQAEGHQLPVSVNISGGHLLDPDFVSSLANQLAAFPQLNPRDLQLEILETAALEDVAHVSKVIKKCTELGVQFALDDFGTGYSSLLYLKRLPARTLKIDQSFVRDLLDTPEGADAIVCIQALASAFKRKIVAEGVEFIEQGIVLLRLNCDVVQGYAIARPMPADEVQNWVETYRPDPAWAASLKLPWRRSDFPLLAAEVEQRRWIKIVATAVKREDSELLLSRIRSLQKSSFGHWYYGIAKDRYGSMPEFKKIPDLHMNVYRISAEIGACLSRGEHTQASALLAEQNACSRVLLEGLVTLRKAIVTHTQKPVLPPPSPSFL